MVNSKYISGILMIVGVFITCTGISIYWSIDDYVSILASMFIILGFLLILASIIIICTNEQYDLLRHANKNTNVNPNVNKNVNPNVNPNVNKNVNVNVNKNANVNNNNNFYY